MGELMFRCASVRLGKVLRKRWAYGERVDCEMFCHSTIHISIIYLLLIGILYQSDGYLAGTVAVVQCGAAHGLGGDGGVATCAVGQAHEIGFAVGKASRSYRCACPVTIYFLVIAPRVIDIC